MYVAVGGRAAGLVAVADTIRESARTAVPALHEMGVETVMLTGDKPQHGAGGRAAARNGYGHR